MIHSINRHSSLALLFATMFIFIGGNIITSCKERGENNTINYDEDIQIETNDDYNSVAINVDSLETANKKISDSLTLKEHRVYYVDYSWSMISKSKEYDHTNINGTGLTLLAFVKERLKESIRDIKGKDVTIEIIPFLDAQLWANGQPHEIFTITKKESFDTSKLKEMDAFIDAIHAIKKPDGVHHYNTHHSIVIKDFLTNRIKDKKQYHMMILLTDGKDESEDDNLLSGATILDNEWELNTKNKYVFGVFADLMQNKEISGELPNRFKGYNNEGKRRFYKKGLNFDFNVFILKQPEAVEHRKHNKAYIPIGGTIPEFVDTIRQDEHYKYTLIQPNRSASYFEIRVDTLTPAKERPNIQNYKFKLRYDNHDGSQFFLSHHEIDLTVIDEKTPNIKFLIANHTNDTLSYVSKELGYCKKLFGIFEPEWSDTITINIPYEKSNDAKNKDEFNKLKLTICSIPDWAKLIGDNEIILDKPSDTVSVTFALDPSNEVLIDGLMAECSINLVGTDGLKAIFVNNVPLSRVKSSNKIGILKIHSNEHCHPFLVFLFWFFITLIALWLLAMACILAYRAKQPKFTDRIPVLQFLTEPDNSNLNLNPNSISLDDNGYLYKFIRYVRLDTKAKYIKHSSWGLHNWWNLRLAMEGDIHVHPLDRNVFVEVIELKPSKKGIEIFVDGKPIRECEMIQLNFIHQIAERQNDKLMVYGCQQPCK